jgi:hypothetical protein
MLASRSVVSRLLRGLGDFSLHPQDRPAGGRLRRPSSAGNTPSLLAPRGRQVIPIAARRADRRSAC